jgi:hypothetical protein
MQVILEKFPRSKFLSRLHKSDMTHIRLRMTPQYVPLNRIAILSAPHNNPIARWGFRWGSYLANTTMTYSLDQIIQNRFEFTDARCDYS